MVSVSALDGNAIAGLLHEVFGDEMTTAVGTCATCGKHNVVGEVEVYLRAPGTVVRCRHCHNVVMVFTRIRETICVDLEGLRSLEHR